MGHFIKKKKKKKKTWVTTHYSSRLIHNKQPNYKRNIYIKLVHVIIMICNKFDVI